MDSEKMTLIDTDAEMDGRLTGKDAHILGRFKGEIDIKGRLLLGDGCRVDAKVVAGTVEIAGEFKGEIKADRLLVLEKARVSGTFEARAMSVREGAQVNGAVNAGEPRRAAAVPGPQRAATGALAG
jgi:cytoskeletal protein CcmA (bactofilin family)